MRSWNRGAARIARSLVAVLALSLLQVVIAPVIAPQRTTPIASAADANDFPSGLGTVYQFLAESYTSGSTTWPEARGGSGATISSSAIKVTNTAGTLGASKSVVAVQGSYLTSITFPATVAYGNTTNPNDYTFFHVARYAPQQAGLTGANYCDTIGDGITNNAGKKNRIFSSSANNWLSGFWACAAGVSYHYGWLTQYNDPVSELAGNNGNNWLLSSDCGYVSTSTSTCNGRYRAFGLDRTISPSTSVVGHSVVVNGGQFPAEVSDFQIAEVISFPTILSEANIIKVETYLSRKYGISLAAGAATKLGVYRSSAGTNLNEPLSTQPQIAIQDANGQTVTTDNSTVITATVTGINGRVIGVATANVIQGVATFDNLGVDGIPGNSYTITYSSNTGLTATNEVRAFTRGGGSETDTALLLNGSNQAAEVADFTNSPFDTTGTFTFEAWVNPSNSCPSAGAVISKLSYMVYCASGVWYIMALANGATGSGITTTIPVEPNEWHHLAFTKSSSSGSILFYYDGVLAYTVASGVTTMTPNNQTFQIGRWDNNTAYWFPGKIDEVRVFNNSQRTATQVLADMKGYADTTDSSLSAYYDFNENSGTKVYNREIGSSSTTDLTVVGSPTWSDVKEVDTSTLLAYTIMKFPRSYITSIGGWKVPANVTNVSALTIGGGGAGGSRVGGGGGAGGYVYRAKVTLTSGGIESITVGIGGLGKANYSGGDGTNSNFGNRMVAIGGGGGGVANSYGGRAGRAGGSGGGTGDASGVGATTQISTGSSDGLGNAGAVGRGGGDWSAGGGGGAGSVGYSGIDGSKPGFGGDGKLDPVGGSNLCLAAGGGGGVYGASGATRSNPGACASGTVTSGSGTAGQLIGFSATANTGSGGGGAGYVNATEGSDVAGGNGGSGVIIVRWITAAKPIFTQPQNDTTTAGLADTITVSANPITPLTRNYQWQVSSDTGTTWANAATGSGINSVTYTTPILETNTSGSRYQYRVIVTDSDTAGLFIIDTSVAVFIVINARITYTGSYTVQKYGSTHQDTFTVLNGTGNKTFAYSPNNRTGITWTSPSANTAVLTIGTTLFVGTYFETITATDTKGAQTSLALSIVVSKADTITVTAIVRTETFTGSILSFTPSFSVSGLKNSDTVTAAAMSWNYNGVENSGTLYAIQSNRPTNAGTYVITPVAPSSLTDSYTAVTIVTAALTVSRATRTISITPPGSPIKFGETKTVTATPSAGAGDGAITFASSTTDSCTVSSTTVTAIKSAGTCAFTATIARGNNYETATSTSGTSTLTKADTLTVTVDAINPLTYTGAQIGITPSVTVSGLKLTNAVGATPATIKYASSGGGVGACANGGACAVGDTGPGGGIVFYDAGSQQSWGRYLEIAKSGWSGTAGEATAQWCSAGLAATVSNVRATTLGSGLSNSTTLATFCGVGAAFSSRAYSGGGKTDWFLPTQGEFQVAYNNRSYLDLSPTGIYWLSHEANDSAGNWVANSWVMSSQGMGGNNKADTTSYRPIRAFAAGDASQNFILTKPTDADSYTVRASDLTLSSGSLSDYQGTNYVDATLRINRAQQSQLFLAEYGAIFGTAYKVIVFGGSGTGAAKVSTASGSASGCNVSGDTLTSTSVGTCLVTAVKAQDKNYETATVTISVYFLEFVFQQPTPPVSTGPGIALSGATSVTLDPFQAPTISGISVSSGRVGDTVTITGAGFTASALQSVKFWRNIIAAIQGTPTNTQIIVLVPSGATTGKILVTTVNGSAVTEGSFSVLP
jgi:hypothetical protein